MSKNLKRTTHAYIGPNRAHRQFVQKITNEKIFVHLIMKNKDALLSTFHEQVEQARQKARQKGSQEFGITIVTKVISPTQFRGITIRDNESALIAKDFEEFQSQIYGKAFAEVHRIFVDYTIDLYNEILEIRPDLTKYDNLSYAEVRHKAFNAIGLDVLPNTNIGGATPYQLANRLNDLGNTRHLIEHNNAIVDELFLRRNPTTTYRLGERVNIEPDEIGQAIALVETLAEDLNKKAIEKFWAR